MTVECLRVRRLIQSCLDDGITLPEKAARHLRGCAECERSYTALTRLRTELAVGAEEAIAGMGEPDLGSVLRAASEREAGGQAPLRKSRRPLRPRRVVAAASLAAAAATVVLFFGVRQLQLISARSFVRSDTRQLVTAMLSEPLYATGSTAAASSRLIGGSTWFDANDLVDGLTPLPSSQDAQAAPNAAN